MTNRKLKDEDVIKCLGKGVLENGGNGIVGRYLLLYYVIYIIGEFIQHK